jgi:hypothetical protein
MSNDSEPGAERLPTLKDTKGKIGFGTPLPSLLLVAVAIPILLIIAILAIGMK